MNRAVIFGRQTGNARVRLVQRFPNPERKIEWIAATEI
jgi:hypothetical protein